MASSSQAHVPETSSGGGDFAQDRLLPDLLRAFERGGEAAQIRNPNATRPFQHVLDPVYAYVTLAERLLAGDASVAQAYNFGPPTSDISRSARWRSRRCKLGSEGARWTSDAGPHPVEARALALDCKKAEAELGVRSLFGSLEAIARTVTFTERFAQARAESRSWTGSSTRQSGGLLCATESMFLAAKALTRATTWLLERCECPRARGAAPLSACKRDAPFHRLW